ncbi:hypothetical protein BD779DRAFT_1788368 [Infundibulicybe gibba]|nr:hypothetical protein BD779DRAFT_1788368 [Infundibulicybe gibba]
MEKQCTENLREADKKWKSTPARSRARKEEHEAHKADLRHNLEEEHYSRAREEWQAILTNSGLNDEHWGEMTVQEKQAVIKALGGDEDDDETPVVENSTASLPQLPTAAQNLLPVPAPMSSGTRSSNVSATYALFPLQPFEMTTTIPRPVNGSSPPLSLEGPKTVVGWEGRVVQPRSQGSQPSGSPEHTAQKNLDQPPIREPRSIEPARAPPKRPPDMSQAVIKARIPGPSYLGPQLADSEDMHNEEAEFEKFKMETRITKIWEFHHTAAVADINLIKDIFASTKTGSLRKEEDLMRIAEHERRMTELREVKEQERKDIVEAERQRRRAEIRSRSIARGPLDHNSLDPETWAKVFEVQTLDVNVNLDEILQRASRPEAAVPGASVSQQIQNQRDNHTQSQTRPGWQIRPPSSAAVDLKQPAASRPTRPDVPAKPTHVANLPAKRSLEPVKAQDDPAKFEAAWARKPAAPPAEELKPSQAAWAKRSAPPQVEEPAPSFEAAWARKPVPSRAEDPKPPQAARAKKHVSPQLEEAGPSFETARAKKAVPPPVDEESPFEAVWAKKYPRNQLNKPLRRAPLRTFGLERPPYPTRRSQTPNPCPRGAEGEGEKQEEEGCPCHQQYHVKKATPAVEPPKAQPAPEPPKLSSNLHLHLLPSDHFKDEQQSSVSGPREEPPVDLESLIAQSLETLGASSSKTTLDRTSPTNEIWVPGGWVPEPEPPVIQPTRPAEHQFWVPGGGVARSVQPPPIEKTRSMPARPTPPVTNAGRLRRISDPASPTLAHPPLPGPTKQPLPTSGILKKSKSKKGAKNQQVIMEEVQDEEDMPAGSEKLPVDSRCILEEREVAPPEMFVPPSRYAEDPMASMYGTSAQQWGQNWPSEQEISYADHEWQRSNEAGGDPRGAKAKHVRWKPTAPAVLRLIRWPSRAKGYSRSWRGVQQPIWEPPAKGYGREHLHGMESNDDLNRYARDAFDGLRTRAPSAV